MAPRTGLAPPRLLIVARSWRLGVRLPSVDVYLKAGAAALLFALAAVSLRARPRQPRHVLLAIFLALVAGNQAMEAYRGWTSDPDTRLMAFRLATLFAVADPLVLLLTVEAWTGASARRRPALAVAGIVACPLLLATFLAEPMTTPRLEATASVALASLLPIYTAAAYLFVLRRATAIGQRGVGYLCAGLAVVALPALLRVSDFPVRLVLIGAGWPSAGYFPGGLGLTSVVVAWAILAPQAKARMDPKEWPLARAGFAVALALAISLLAVAAYGALLGPTLGLPRFYTEFLVFALGRGAASVRWIAFSACVTAAVVRHDAFGLSLPDRRAAARIVLGASFFVGGAILMAFLGYVGIHAESSPPLQLAVLVGAVTLSQGLRWFVDALAWRLYGVPRPNDRAGLVDSYRDVVLEARRTRAAPDVLARARRDLGLDDVTADLVERESAPPPLAPGRVFAGRYRIERLLARGGQGRVFLASDTSSGERVVLKELPVGRETAASLPEVRLAKVLAHPRLVRTLDVIETPDSVVLVQEYLEGGSLAAALAEAPLSAARARALLFDVLEGLAALHARGIVHRDIKPGNVLLAKDGSAKLADFGLARIRRGVTVDLEAEVAAGTPDFMAPEQRRGYRAGPPADVYAVGLVARQLLPAPLPPGVAAVVERALREDPGERWPDAAAMLAALRAAEPEK